MVCFLTAYVRQLSLVTENYVGNDHRVELTRTSAILEQSLVGNRISYRRKEIRQ